MGPTLTFTVFEHQITLTESYQRQNISFKLAGFYFRLEIIGKYDYKVGAFGSFREVEFQIQLDNSNIVCMTAFNIEGLFQPNKYLDRSILVSIFNRYVANQILKAPITKP